MSHEVEKSSVKSDPRVVDFERQYQACISFQYYESWYTDEQRVGDFETNIVLNQFGPINVLQIKNTPSP